jgi:hypothetical protein
LHYSLKEYPNEIRIGSIIVEGDLTDGYLNGYWIGNSPESQDLVACPYVLTNHGDLQDKNRQWLAQDCHPEIPSQ